MLAHKTAAEAMLCEVFWPMQIPTLDWCPRVVSSWGCHPWPPRSYAFLRVCTIHHAGRSPSTRGTHMWKVEEVNRIEICIELGVPWFQTIHILQYCSDETQPAMAESWTRIGWVLAEDAQPVTWTSSLSRRAFSNARSNLNPIPLSNPSHIWSRSLLLLIL